MPEADPPPPATPLWRAGLAEIRGLGNYSIYYNIMNKCIKCGLLLGIVFSSAMIVPDYCKECKHIIHKEHHIQENQYNSNYQNPTIASISGTMTTTTTTMEFPDI